MFWPAAKLTDPAYTWYKIYACCNGHTQKSVDECSKNEPKEIVQPLYECMKRKEVVSMKAAMHAVADSFMDFPTVLVDGKPGIVPEPDTHGDDPTALIKEVCKRAAAAGATDMPSACA